MARRVNNAVDQGNFYVDATSNQPPPFLTKTYDMVDDSRTDDTVSWNQDGRSFVVWRPAEFARDLLPQHFKHNNFSSFVRQLNTYGFRKTDPDRWEFSNEHFIRNRRDLLKGIHRRKTGNAASPVQPDTQNLMTAVSAGNSAIEVGSFGGLADEVESLRRDKNVLMMELVRLRQQQQASEKEIGSLQGRLESTEQNQRNIMAFLTKAMQEPGFLQQVLGSNPGPQRLTDGEMAGSGRRKRRATRSKGPMEAATSPNDSDAEAKDRALVQYQGRDDFTPQLRELLDAERDISPTGDATSSQEGPSRLEDVTGDVNSAFHNMQLALPSSVTIKEDEHEQQLDPMQSPESRGVERAGISHPYAQPQEDFETFTANLASMLPKAGSQGSLATPAVPAAPAAAASSAGNRPTPPPSSTPAAAPLSSPWAHPSMQSGPGPSSSYPLPHRDDSLSTPSDFAMSLEMMQQPNAGAQGVDPNGFATIPSHDHFWEQWVNDVPESGVGPTDADIFNRIPSSYTAPMEGQQGNAAQLSEGK